jgi:hypothetical protein
MILGGLLLFARPVMVIGGLLVILALIMAADGVTKIVSAFNNKLGNARWWAIFNGIVNLLLGLLIWWQGASTGAVVLGIGLGIYIMSNGWTALFAPDDGVEDVDVARATNEHPDERLGLPPNAEFGRLRAAAVEREAAALPIDTFWIIVLILVFFAIHAGRLQADWTWLGLMSPSGNGRKSLAFRRSLEVKRPCADISDDESHEIRSEVPLGMDYQIPPGGAEWGGWDAGARTGARDL